MPQTSRLTGLDDIAVADRVSQGLTNAFTQETSRSLWSIVRENLFTLFNAIILSCFVLLLVLGRWQDAQFGLSALANTVIGTTQEYRAKRTLDRISVLSAPHARVLRNSEERTVALAEVVMDDVIILRAGDQVPADAVVFSARDLEVDESMLTGESEPVDKTDGDSVLSGSVVVAGEARALVDRVGAQSYANTLATEAKRFSLVTSELRSSIDRVLTWVTWIIGPVTLLVFNAQVMVLGGWSYVMSTGVWVDVAVSTIAAVVAMVPLGLVLMTSIAFAVGSVKLARQQVLVQELPAVEGLARVDMICLDKTGTLTEGTITFDAAWPVAERPGWQQALAWFGAQPDANMTARSLRAAFSELPASAPVSTVQFSSARKWSAVTFDDGMWILGGPEMVFPGRAQSSMTDDEQRLMRRATELAATGSRTLVLAHGSPTNDDTLPADVVPIALLTFRESIRSSAADTLRYFADQGVGVRILSGDNPSTVAAIARDVGLTVADGFDARDLPTDQDELARVLEENIVFGRVTPDQKKLMVRALKSAGHTVAMTGDGVNDALAIKEADIGIAMNSAADATKAVARLVLLDGQFSHLPAVVAEGRQVIANIERVSMLFLTKTAYATLLAVVFGLLVLPFPFLPRQLSVTDGLTIGIPAFFLALLPNARRYEPGFLRRSLTFAIPAGIVVTIALTAVAVISVQAGISTVELRTGSTLLLTIIGLWILVVLSRPFSLLKVVIIVAMVIGLVLVFAVPIVADFLQLVELSTPMQYLVLIVAAIAIGLIEIVRVVHRRVARPRRR
ncbi:HAD-IC family P-type ATPase [Leifsonia sp. A12D58]|uniref:HAD-IC family P-type ATPase n=1 Tax=Leifsonia sp. A12D58 TaxID=3397674 RepID=UPI0039DFAC75